MTNELECPKCGSTDLIRNIDGVRVSCYDCRYHWKIDEEMKE